MLYTVVQKKIAQSLMHHHHFQLFAVESRRLRQDARQRSLSANQYKIFVNDLNIL